MWEPWCPSAGQHCGSTWHWSHRGSRSLEENGANPYRETPHQRPYCSSIPILTCLFPHAPFPMGTGLTCELCDSNSIADVFLHQTSPLTRFRRINGNECIRFPKVHLRTIKLQKFELWWDIVRDLLLQETIRNPEDNLRGDVYMGTRRDSTCG